MSTLSGKTALVTGAGAPGGIGMAIARALKDAGAEVIITSTTDRIRDRASELKISGFVTDLVKMAECERLVSNLQKLDILVNNAGMTSMKDPMTGDEATDLSKVSEAAWQRGISRNLDTAFNLTKVALPLLRNSPSGRIIMISSVTGGLMAMRNQPVYAAAKAGLVGLTRSLALDEARFGITCNAVLPGWISTDTQNEYERAQGNQTPLGRNGRPDEIAGLVTWLASQSAGFITGQAIVVDGGNSIAEERSI